MIADSFKSMSTRFVRRIRYAVLLFAAFGMGCIAAGDGQSVAKDFGALSSATRIEAHDVGVRPLAIVTDPERIRVARDFIKQYDKGWKSPRWQGSAASRRRFDFWDGDRYLGGFGINPDTITTDNYYQEAPVDQIARIAALFELRWPPPQ
jgi:hypothetical protein